MAKREPNWKKIAEGLAQRVNFAVTYLKAPGSGQILNMKTGKGQSWREYFADGLEAVPGVKVDREIMHLYDLPWTKRKKALRELMESRKNVPTTSGAKEL